MTADLFGTILNAPLPALLAASESVANLAGAHLVDPPPHANAPTGPILAVAVYVALAGLCLGMLLCLWRLVRGPTLSDRVLAADLLALHVVGIVIALTIYLNDMVFFPAALAVGILGFVSTVGFAQYIHATAGNPEHPHADAPDPDNVRRGGVPPLNPAPIR